MRLLHNIAKDGLCHIADIDMKGTDSVKRVYHPEGKCCALTTCGGGIESLKFYAGKSVKRNFPSFNKPIRLATIKDGGQGNRIYSIYGKAITLSAQSGGAAGNGNLLISNQTPLCGAMRGRYLIDDIRQDGKMKTAGLTKQYIEVRHDQKTNCITTVQKDNNIVYIDITDHNNKKVRYEIGDIDWRKLTPTECERLQTVKDGYTAKGLDENFKEVKISDTQRYKMLGNGWTVEVIEHIVKLILSKESKSDQTN